MTEGITPSGEPEKKSRVWLIVILVVVVLCVCCAAVLAAGWFLGDPILNALGIY